LRARTKELGTLVAGMPATVEERVENNQQPNPERAVLTQRIYTLEDSLAALERSASGISSER